MLFLAPCRHLLQPSRNLDAFITGIDFAVSEDSQPGHFLPHHSPLPLCSTQIHKLCLQCSLFCLCHSPIPALLLKPPFESLKHQSSPHQSTLGEECRAQGAQSQHRNCRYCETLSRKKTPGPEKFHQRSGRSFIKTNKNKNHFQRPCLEGKHSPYTNPKTRQDNCRLITQSPLPHGQSEMRGVYRKSNQCYSECILGIMAKAVKFSLGI